MFCPECGEIVGPGPLRVRRPAPDPCVSGSFWSLLSHDPLAKSAAPRDAAAENGKGGSR